MLCSSHTCENFSKSTTVSLKGYIFQNIFFMFVDSVLPPYTPENISLLPMHITLRIASSSASSRPARCHSDAQQVKNLWCAVRSVGCLRKIIKYRVLASELHKTVWLVFVTQEQHFWHFSWQINSTTAGIWTSYSFNIRELILVPVDKKNAHVFSYGSIMKLCCVTVQNKGKYPGLSTSRVNPPLFRDMAL
jgi:hypothetical protein